MTDDRTRRAFLAATALGAIAGLTACANPAVGREPGSGRTQASQTTPTDPTPEFAGLEDEFDARLGVVAINTGSGSIIEHRPDERFAYASTIKAIAAAAVLQTREINELDVVIHYSAEDLVTYSPITEQHVGTGMPLRDIATAAVQYSDNTAGNLLFAQLGGAVGLQELLRGLGDDTTSVDRLEPDLNEATPGDLRDTSTPRALATTLQAYSFGRTLSAPKRELFATWLQGNTTGGKLIRAAAPEGWTVGDKTGAAGYGTRNDIAVLWPPADSANQAPIVMAVLSSRAAEDASYDDALIARSAAVALTALGVR